MSINHFSSPKPLWYNQMDPTNASEPHTLLFHPHRTGSPHPKELMFEKPLTPSDVGKLNRLVIPKQHAEKYFPLAGAGAGSGHLLGFEDDSGKSWRFRYSYWNSSQSYVLTKGWSRYVKENRLDAGDAVLFERHRSDCDRFFIGWRRRTAAAQDSGGGEGCYHARAYHAGGSGPNVVPTGNLKRLRLFGVNLECQTDESPEPSTPAGSPAANHGGAHYNYEQQRHYYHSSQAYVVNGG